ncbi:MAG: hypothetical protein E3J72_03485 [Planctomycetota bacterium]|nr:MAG: hypothetical protein E3J72_03485 [Planctomycetota bacterium]
MKQKIILTLILVIVLSAGACTATRYGKVKLVYEPARGNALDVILLGDRAVLVGTFYFSHMLHYTDEKDGGYGITCVECHHEYKGNPEVPPRDCRSCHYPHETKTTPSI